MKGKYMVDGQVVNPSAVNAIDNVQQVIAKHSDDISPQSLRKIKQIFDESVSEAGGYTNADLTTNYTLKAQREAANQIRGILHQASPGAAAAGIAFLSSYVASAMRTPAWRTGSALIKDRLADALVRGDVRVAAALLGRLGAQVPAALTA